MMAAEGVVDMAKRWNLGWMVHSDMAGERAWL